MGVQEVLGVPAIGFYKGWGSQRVWGPKGFGVPAVGFYGEWGSQRVWGPSYRVLWGVGVPEGLGVPKGLGSQL